MESIQLTDNRIDICQPALSKLYILLTVALNVATDLYLILIPVPMLWSTQLPTFKKLTLVVVFSGALFVMAAGIVRGVVILEVCTLFSQERTRVRFGT
jgi:hypothetical protein